MLKGGSFETDRPFSPMLVITLSTVPPRFDKIGPTLNSLLAQSVRPDRIVVYVPERYNRFPDYDGRLPEVPAGVEVARVATDYGPATKVLPALADYAGRDCDILFCDDDSIYPPGWAARYLKARETRPAECLVQAGTEVGDEVEDATMQRDLQPRALRLWRATDPFFQARRMKKRVVERLTGRPQPRATRRAYLRSGYIDILGGSGGVMVRPGFFDDDVFDIPDDLRAVDDVWLSGMLAKRGVPIWLDAGHARNLCSQADAAAALSQSVIGGDDRRAANGKCIAYMRARYGIWP